MKYQGASERKNEEENAGRGWGRGVALADADRCALGHVLLEGPRVGLLGEGEWRVQRSWGGYHGTRAWV